MEKDKKIRTADFLYLETHFDSLDALLWAYQDMEQAIKDNKDIIDLTINIDYDITTDEDNQKDFKFVCVSFRNPIKN